jgi:hypothetical protein
MLYHGQLSTWIGLNVPTVVAMGDIVAKTANHAQNTHFGHIF